MTDLKLPDDHRWPMYAGVPVVTQSMVTTFLACPRCFYYSTVQGLRPKVTSIPLSRGTWAHALLEARANGDDWRSLHAERVKQEPDLLVDGCEDLEGLGEEVLRLVETYDWYYKNDPLEPVGAEVTVTRPLGDRALYMGRVDLIARTPSDGKVWIVDHKTHRTFPDWRYRQLAYQHYSYLWAAQTSDEYAELGLEQPAGFMYDYLKTSAISAPRLNKNGSVSSVGRDSFSYPTLIRWLKENGLLVGDPSPHTPVRDLVLAVVDETKRASYMEALAVAWNRDYTSLLRRDYVVYEKGAVARAMSQFATAARSMLEYDWRYPTRLPQGQHGAYRCRYEDLALADLVRGDSSLEQRLHYDRYENPLDYYGPMTGALPGPDKKEKRSEGNRSGREA